MEYAKAKMVMYGWPLTFASDVIIIWTIHSENTFIRKPVFFLSLWTMPDIYGAEDIIPVFTV